MLLWLYVTCFVGAEVTLECKDRIRGNIVYSKTVKTDSSGSYTIFVDANQANQNCDASLVTSPLPDCREPTPGRDHSRVILNRYNGIATKDRFVNNLGFMKQKVVSACAKIFRRYRDNDDGEEDSLNSLF
ncbi:hypothetical protein V8G54_037653 [Vigna mungo]|uniref:Uncharacterized protein n=1 Tax=Vigna mungo TaxID=3915 RepID=A0AAQ3MIZ1_VIGMU